MPCPEGATRIAGRASAMFGQLDKASRATLLAFSGHPQLEQVEMMRQTTTLALALTLALRA